MGQIFSDIFGQNFNDVNVKTPVFEFETSFKPLSDEFINKWNSGRSKDLYLNYVLQLQHGMFYIGRTQETNISNREFKHLIGAGAVWTTLHPPIRLVEQIEGDKWMEDNLVYKYMDKYTIDRVRGGSYCQVDLDSFQRRALQNKLKSVNNICYECGQPGHFANKCKNKIPKQKSESKSIPTSIPTSSSKSTTVISHACYICGQMGHFVKDCTNDRSNNSKTKTNKKRSRSRSPVRDKIHQTQSTKPIVSQISNLENTTCIRCNNLGHKSDNCFASINIKTGRSLARCSRCSRDNHRYDRCYAKRDVFGRSL